ncbi:hypothetical protein HGRIS_007531 [Hohenbuehelia grisea]|uniref:Sensor domain-containing protein n=1 Tax=Hohenbuehelia grisea TaxID=104357 RepID=A0ABR3J554_9AGAR
MAPSLVQSLLSLFSSDDELVRPDGPGALRLLELEYGPRSASSGGSPSRGWLHYFSPLWTSKYYKAIFHLMLVDFTYTLVAWIYVVVGVTCGMALLALVPLGLGLSFLTLLGARTFARGEIALQTFFYPDLAYPERYPPRPIFKRWRAPTADEVEIGFFPGGLIRENFFLRNAHAMFVDPTSYHAVLYFLFVKPVISAFIMVNLCVLIPISLVLVLPAPFVFRAAHKLGTWQANTALEWL